MRLNVKLLRKIQAHISEEPRRFAMGVYDRRGRIGERVRIDADSYNAGNKFENGQEIPPCGTIACIMGWGAILSDNEHRNSPMWAPLCSATAWPKHFRQRYRRAKTPMGRARIAVARIEHFIKTKGAE